MAAAIGFALATYVPEGWPRPETPDPEIAARLSDLDAGLSDVTERIATLEGSVESLSAEVSAPDPETEDALAALRENIDAVRDDVTQLSETVSNLPTGSATVGEMPDFTGEFNEQMESFRAEIDRVTASAEAEAEAARREAEAARQEAEETRAAAQRAERQAALRAALAEVEVALDTGAPFEENLAGLEGLDVPPALADAAETGVTPLAELQRTFADAARAALRVAPRGPEGDDGAMDRITSFLMAQTNARSLEPREGNDTDAVLSRAEAELRGGDLEAALSELGALPDAPREALGDWLARAEARRSAKEALASLASEIDAM